MSVWTIVVAAGSGSRFGGDQPKQYRALGDRRVLDWSLETARRASDAVVLVVSSDRASHPEPLADVVVAGGATRSDSVRAGLAQLPADCEIVVIHDGARPMATVELYAAVIATVGAGSDAAVPGIALTDTVKRVVEGRVVETLDRADLVAVQTPQAFRAGALRRAHASGGEATDDAALIERSGGTVAVVAGEVDNVKLTRPGDVAVLAAALASRAPS